MATNPYQSPSEISGEVAEYDRRSSALRSVRMATLLLLVPGILNYQAFDAEILVPSVPPGIVPIFRTINLVGIGLAVLFCWQFFVPTLVLIGRAIRKIVAGHVETVRWDDALFRSLEPAALLAIPGALLWCGWVVAVYYLRLDFFPISVLLGIPGHLLAAGLYVPLAVRWFKLTREKPAET